MSTENVSGILFLVQSACLERRFLDDPALSIEQLNCGQTRISFSAEKQREQAMKTVSSVIGQIGRETSRQLLRGLFGNLRK